MPKLKGFDHIHVYVASWERAEAWYKDVLGFHRVEELMPWAIEGGPLTIEDKDRTVHLALFEREDHPGSTAIAFATSGEEFLTWKTHLEDLGLKLRIADHKLSYSLYFYDPDQNMHEITTYEHELVRSALT